MNILLKKAVRDMWRAKLRTLAIILAIMISVGTGIGMVNATGDIFRSFDKRLEDTHYEDISIQFVMDALDLSMIEDVDGVDEVMGRLLIKTQVEIDGDEYESHWLSSPYYDKEPYAPLNGYLVNSGKYVSSPTAKECMIGYLFSDANGVGAGSTVTVNYLNKTIPLEVTGVVSSPEYAYVIGDAGWPMPSLLLPLFTTYEMTKEVLNLGENTYNEIIITVEDGANAREVKQAVEDMLIMAGYHVTQSLLGTQETDYQFSRADAKGIGQSGWAFGIIILIVTAVVIYNSMNRLVASQRTYIGVMGALGGRRRDILLHYSVFGLIMGVIGSGLGLLVGIGLSVLTVWGYTQFLGIPVASYSLDPFVVLEFCGIGVLIAFLGSLLGSIRLVKIGPREALSSAYVTQDFSKKPLIEKILGPTVGRKVLNRVPIRNLARHRVRTAVTILAIGVSLIMIFASMTMAFNMLEPINDNYDKYETWDVKVGLVDYMSFNEAIGKLNSADYKNVTAEGYLDDYAPVQIDGGTQFVHIQAFQHNTTLRHFNVIEGKKDFNEGVLIGSILAKDLDVGVGDSLTFVWGNSTQKIKITGITGELIDDSVFTTLAVMFGALGSARVVNSIIVDQKGMDKDAFEEKIESDFSVVSYSYTEDVRNGMASLLESLMAIFVLFILFGVLAEILFISTTIVLNILDREAEFVSLRTMGASPWRIRMMVVMENLLLFGAGVVVGIPLSLLTTKWAIWYTTQDLMRFDITAGPEVYIVTISIALLSTFLASVISAMHVTKQKLPDIIRQKLGS